MKYWLVKTEPETYSIDDLKRDKRTAWDNVRNYQARNYLQDMQTGDTVLIYHSSSSEVGIFGVAKVAKEAYPDESQFDRKSAYFDKGSTRKKPRWYSPDLRFVKKLKTPVLLGELRHIAALSKMPLLQKGSRLSVQPVSESEYEAIAGFYKKQTGDLF